jgi:tetratricopeptide (TPR) repeat protein
MSITLRQLGFRSAILASILSGTLLFAADNTQANTLLQQGSVDQAAALLEKTLAAEPSDAFAHQLLCRVYYAQEMPDAAVQACEQAVSHAPGDSDTQLWMGRAYGLKASHASAFTAFGIAKKVHIAFERAVEINPSNIAAINDLGEFYVDAPSIVGGGLDKAESLASRMRARFPSQYHRLMAMIAEKKNDLGTAENEYKAAVEAGPTPQAYVDLGHFYQHHNQPDKALQPLKAAIDADRGKDAAIVDVATILTAAHSSPQLAESLLRQYLSSPARSDAAPAFKVHVQLGQLLQGNGDTAGAQREYAAALALASHYAPARKALAGS